MNNQNCPIALQSLSGDSVAVLTDHAQVGDVIEVKNRKSSFKLVCVETIPIYHKISLHPVQSDEQIIRNGVVIGIATAHIEAGSLVHVHNLRSLRATHAQRLNGNWC